MSVTAGIVKQVGGRTGVRARLLSLLRGNSLTPVAAILLFGLIWEVAVQLSDVNPLFMPPLSQVLTRLFEMLGPGAGATPDFILLRHLGATLFALSAGFLIVALFSSVVGLIMGMSRVAHAWLNPIISLFMVLPNVAFVPIIILWMGLGMPTVIVVVVVSSCFPIIYTAAAGVRAIPQRMVWAARSTGASNWQILRTVMIGATMPYLITGHKLALGRAWRAVLVGEIFASTKFGIGFMIFDARNFLDTKAMFAGILVVGILGVFIERVLFGFIERRTIERWGISGKVSA